MCVIFPLLTDMFGLFSLQSIGETTEVTRELTG